MTVRSKKKKNLTQNRSLPKFPFKPSEIISYQMNTTKLVKSFGLKEIERNNAGSDR